MNFIRKHEYGFHAGNYVLHNPTGTPICSLGPEITVFVRRVVSQTHIREAKFVKYVVEIVESLIHTATDPLSKNGMATLCIPVSGADCRIAMSVFKGDGMGAKHKVGLQEFQVGEKGGYVMTIDGLLWDGRIIHVKDIVA